MKYMVLPLALAVLLGLAPPAEARGHGGHHHHHHHRFFGGPVFVGPWPRWGPYWYPWYPGSPPYARRVVIQPEQWVYIERSTPTPTYWYYCPDARAYYPYIQQCPSPWLRVVPAPTTLAP